MAATTHPDMLHFDRPVASWWEASAAPLEVDTSPLERDGDCDIAIIGAGYTGLSAALRLRERHGADVRVLEAAEPGWGASGRNGGFCALGASKLSLARMVARYGLDDTRRFFDIQRRAVALVQETAERFEIDIWASEMGELALAHKPSRMKDFAGEREAMAKIAGKRMVLLTVDELKARGCYSPAFHGGLWGGIGMSLHPLRYVRGLARAAAGNGAKIHGRSRVVRWQESAGKHRLTTAAGGTLTARTVLIATNGFTSEDVSPRLAGRLLPALSSILVTRPIDPAEQAEQGWTSRQMAYDSRRLLHYFRLLPDGRFLFGGRGGTDGSERGHAGLERRLRRNFEALFPAWSTIEHTHFWKGYVCLAYDLVPYIGPLDDRRSVFTAIAYHGNGVAMASLAGRAVADLIAGDAASPNLPSVLTRRLARFPLPALRPAYLKGAYLWYDLVDRMP